MLHQLSRVWEKAFESLLKLLTKSIVVHADETSWSIKSVWAFLSEHSRVVLFGVNKDAETLVKILDPKSYQGTVVSDNAAVYGKFTNSQKCWAHLLRKAIKLTLLDPENQEYRDFEQTKLDDPIADSFRLLRSELLGLMMNEQLFTFVSNPSVAPTNNEAERSLRDAATARRVGRTNKTLTGARRQTIIQSVLESIRTQLPTFTLRGILDEAGRWKTAGESCFAALLREANAEASEKSILDSIYPHHKEAQDKKRARKIAKESVKSILAPATG